MQAELACLLIVEAVQLGVRGAPAVPVRSRDVAVERDAHRVDHCPHAVFSLCSRDPGIKAVSSIELASPSSDPSAASLHLALTRHEARSNRWSGTLRSAAPMFRNDA